MIEPIRSSKSAMSAALVAVALACTLGGCQSTPAWQDPGPEATFKQFLMDWFRGDRQAAFGAVSADDRQALTSPLSSLAESLDADHQPKPSQLLVVGHVDNPYDLKDIDVVDPLTRAPTKGQHVELALTYNDKTTGEATVIWGGERWFVDLPVAAGRDSGRPRQQ